MSAASLTILTLAPSLSQSAESATTAQSFSLKESGQGRVQGVDFASVGTMTSPELGAFATEVSSDPLSVVFSAPSNGEMTMTSRGVITMTSGADQLFAIETGSYRFRSLSLPNGAVVPDLSKDVTVAVKARITGGAGRYANATGTMEQKGTISPVQISPDPTAVNTVTYSFVGSGAVQVGSGGSASAPRVSFTDLERRTLAGEAKALPVRPGPLPAGTYFAEMPHWRVTFRVGDGWRNNGAFADSVGLSNGSLANPATTGFLIVDDPAIFDDVIRPTQLASTRIDLRDWLRNLPGMTVGETVPIDAGAPGRSVAFSYRALDPSANVIAMFAIRALRSFAPLFSGQSADMQVFDSPGSDRLLVSAAGGLDPRRTLDAQLVMVERR